MVSGILVLSFLGIINDLTSVIQCGVSSGFLIILFICLMNCLWRKRSHHLITELHRPIHKPKLTYPFPIFLFLSQNTNKSAPLIPSAVISWPTRWSYAFTPKRRQRNAPGQPKSGRSVSPSASRIISDIAHCKCRVHRECWARATVGVLVRYHQPHRSTTYCIAGANPQSALASRRRTKAPAGLQERWRRCRDHPDWFCV